MEIWRKREDERERSYVFECCFDRFGFVLVLQVLVCHLKDILLFLPFLFILRHVTWGEKAPAGRVIFTGEFSMPCVMSFILFPFFFLPASGAVST